ncbi:uncharacterized protein VICG_00862 [Vittaforma corneae ATCC 50505]|uniref:Glycoside hydrolase family 19 catalytic domain-containing protein n=1 Tax=Vittaforma corneae (strain ATCC 50505) TaxID=993615 RepID=L2GNE0_VITCO|nr:uncharacterized protein VICG_00862 [Vittaforma corneae ATCC 50505]ELA42015.1 hypothetical protein VICG_00862 [Vittaforma corneae ATCC 50505]
MNIKRMLVDLHIFISALIYLGTGFAFNCKKGATECAGNVMRVCTDEGYWSETECPTDSSCSTNSGSISCKKVEDSEDAVSIDKPLEVKKGRRRSGPRTVTVTKRLSDEIDDDEKPSKIRKKSSQSVKTVTKQPKEIDFEVEQGASTGKEVSYSIILSGGQGGAPNIAQVASSSPSTMQQNPSVNNVSGTTSAKQMSTQPDSSGSSSLPANMPPSAGTTSQPPSGTASSSSTPTPSPSPSSGQSPAPSQPSPSPSSGQPPAPSQPSPSPSSGQPPAPSQPSPSPSSGQPPAPSQPSPSPSSGQPPAPSPSQPSSSPGQSSQPSTDAKSSSQQSPSSSSGSDSKPGAGGQMVTSEQVTSALKENGMNPNSKYLDAVVKSANTHFKDKDFLAMYLAQLAHESGGYVYIEEIACKDTKCPGQYGTGAPGKSYYGRGFIQLSWPDNYKSASQDLGMGDKLYQNPDLVAQDVDIAVKVSEWFWDKKVMTAPGVKDKKQFGSTTKAINGAIECGGSGTDQAKKRYTLYKSMAKAMGITNLASEAGCYPV